VGPPSSQVCQRNLDLLTQICNYLGVLLALEGPSAILPFLGIVLDTTRMEAMYVGSRGKAYQAKGGSLLLVGPQ